MQTVSFTTFAELKLGLLRSTRKSLTSPVNSRHQCLFRNTTESCPAWRDKKHIPNFVGKPEETTWGDLEVDRTTIFKWIKIKSYSDKCTLFMLFNTIFIKKYPTCFEPIYGSSSGAHLFQITSAVHSRYTLKCKL
jgi:hypothetical protein